MQSTSSRKVKNSFQKKKSPIAPQQIVHEPIDTSEGRDSDREIKAVLDTFEDHDGDIDRFETSLDNANDEDEAPRVNPIYSR